MSKRRVIEDDDDSDDDDVSNAIRLKSKSSINDTATGLTNTDDEDDGGGKGGGKSSSKDGGKGEGGGKAGSGTPPSPESILPLTPEQKKSIASCHIRVNKQGGKFSSDVMSRALARLMPHITKVEGIDESGNTGDGTAHVLIHDYQKYMVSKSEVDAFFKRDIYTSLSASAKSRAGSSANSNNSDGKSVTDDEGDIGNVVGPSEEAILLEIEVLRRSPKGIKLALFRNSGGKLVFGPWWNYTLTRVLELNVRLNGEGPGPSDAMDTSDTYDYTAVKVLLSLFTFLRKDLLEVVRVGKLAQLKNKFSVDWEVCVENAGKVVNHICRQSGRNGAKWEVLKKEFELVVEHMDRLRGCSRKKPVPAVSSIMPSSSTLSVASGGGVAGVGSSAAAAATTSASSHSQNNSQVTQSTSDAGRKSRMEQLKKLREQQRLSLVGSGNGFRDTSPDNQGPPSPRSREGGKDGRDSGRDGGRDREFGRDGSRDSVRDFGGGRNPPSPGTGSNDRNDRHDHGAWGRQRNSDTPPERWGRQTDNSDTSGKNQPPPHHQQNQRHASPPGNSNDVGGSGGGGGGKWGQSRGSEGTWGRQRGSSPKNPRQQEDGHGAHDRNLPQDKIGTNNDVLGRFQGNDPSRHDDGYGKKPSANETSRNDGVDRYRHDASNHDGYERSQNENDRNRPRNGDPTSTNDDGYGKRPPTNASIGNNDGKWGRPRNFEASRNSTSAAASASAPASGNNNANAAPMGRVWGRKRDGSEPTSYPSKARFTKGWCEFFKQKLSNSSNAAPAGNNDSDRSAPPPDRGSRDATDRSDAPYRGADTSSNRYSASSQHGHGRSRSRSVERDRGDVRGDARDGRGDSYGSGDRRDFHRGPSRDSRDSNRSRSPPPSSRYDDRRNDRFDRASDRDRDRDGDRGNWNASTGGNYSDRGGGRSERESGDRRGTSGGGDYPRRDSGSGAYGRGRDDERDRYNQGSKRDRDDRYGPSSQDREDGELPSQKRFRGPNESSNDGRYTNAPAGSVRGASADVALPAAARAGRGRGRDINRPAWMTKASDSNGSVNPSAATGNPSSSHPVVSPSVAPSSHTTISSGFVGNVEAPMAMDPAPSNGVNPGGGVHGRFTAPGNPSGPGPGRGRGRGRHVNVPAWQTHGSSQLNK